MRAGDSSNKKKKILIKKKDKEKNKKIEYNQEKKINEKTVKNITIEELNEILTKNDIQFNDIQISCLCSKFSIPDDLRIIDVEKLEEYLINKKMNKIIEFDKEKSLDFE